MTSEMSQKYLQIQIQDDLKYDIRIENAELERYFPFALVWRRVFWVIHSGHFYREDDRNDFLTSDDVDDMVIRHNGGIRSVCSMDAPHGSIDLVDDVRDARICSLTWRTSTHVGERNEIKKLHEDKRYMVEIGDWNEAGAMGWIPITVKEQSWS